MSKVVVRFSALDSIYEIPDLDSYTDDEVDCLWYTDEEYRVMSKEKRSYMRVARRNNHPQTLLSQEELDCTYGVLTSIEEREYRKDRIIEIINEVLLEQEAQWEEGFDVLDDDAIADAYYEGSSACQLDAIEIAKILHCELEIEHLMEQQQEKRERREQLKEESGHDDPKVEASNKNKSIEMPFLSPTKRIHHKKQRKNHVKQHQQKQQHQKNRTDVFVA